MSPAAIHRRAVNRALDNLNDQLRAGLSPALYVARFDAIRAAASKMRDRRLMAAMLSAAGVSAFAAFREI